MMSAAAELRYRPPMEVAAGFLDRAPVPLREMAAELGLSVNTEADLAPEISGQITRVRRAGGDRYHIDVNRRDSGVRRRFTLAHEIAHFLLHREYLDDELTDDRMYRSRLGDRMERQANRLAAQLLMPANLVRVAWSAGARDVAGLAGTFDVSAQAMEIRLGELGLALAA
jgi:predicted transcriptional regulator